MGKPKAIVTYCKYNRIYLLHTYIRPWRVYMGCVWFYLSSWVKISWNLFWQIQIQLKSVLCKRRELVGEKMINMWWTFSMFDEVWINFGEKFYAVETAWTVQRNSSIISKEIHEACHFFIIFCFGHNGSIFLWISSEILMRSFCMSVEILLNSFYFCCIFLHFLCISEKILGISYGFLMHFLCMNFLCNSYAVFKASYVFGKSVWSFGKSVWNF